jgi:hypothetical protein
VDPNSFLKMVGDNDHRQVQPIPTSPELLRTVADRDPTLDAVLSTPCAATREALQALWVTRGEAARLLELWTASGPLKWRESALEGAAVAYRAGSASGARRIGRVLSTAQASAAAEGAGLGEWILTVEGGCSAVPLSEVEADSAPLTDSEWAHAWDAAEKANFHLGSVQQVHTKGVLSVSLSN